MHLKNASVIDEKILYFHTVSERGAVPIDGVEIQYSGQREGEAAPLYWRMINIPYTFSEPITIPYISRII